MSKNCMGLQPDHPLVRSSGEIREREGGGGGGGLHVTVILLYHI